MHREVVRGIRCGRTKIKNWPNRWAMKGCRVCQNCISVPNYENNEAWNGAFEYAHCRWMRDCVSGSNLKMIRLWLQNCLGCHTECNSRKITSQPTRILDLRGFEDGSIRLALGAEIGEGQYATLSYTWGGRQDFVLSTSNMGEFARSIWIDALPKTFLGAAVICRKLGFDFLWSEYVSHYYECKLSRMSCLRRMSPK